MKKSLWAGVAFAAALAFVANFVSCSSDTETEYVSKNYVEAVTFSTTTKDSVINVSLSTKTDGATIHYTTDGNSPSTSSSVYSKEISVNGKMTIKAFAIKNGMENSPVSVYTVDSPIEIVKTYTEPVTFSSKEESGVSASATIGELTDIASLEFASADGVHTFAASEGYASYSWYVDGVKQDCTSNTFAYEQANAGTYSILLTVKKSESVINTYSATATLTIN